MHSAAEWVEGDGQREEAEDAAWEVEGDDVVHGAEVILSVLPGRERWTGAGFSEPLLSDSCQASVGIALRAMTDGQTTGIHAVDERPRIDPQDPREVGKLRGSL